MRVRRGQLVSSISERAYFPESEGPPPFREAAWTIHCPHCDLILGVLDRLGVWYPRGPITEQLQLAEGRGVVQPPTDATCPNCGGCMNIAEAQ